MSFGSRFNTTSLMIISTLQIIFSWSVLSFFFCSGFLRKKVENKQGLFVFIEKRFKRLILPSIAFSIAYKLLMLSLASSNLFEWSFSVPRNFIDIIKFLFFPASPQFYFLYYLFGISVLSTTIEFFLSQNKFFIITSLMMPISYLFMDSPQDLHGPELILLPIYFFSYMIGSLTAKYDRNNEFIFIAILFIPIALSILVTQKIFFISLWVPIFLFKILHNFNFLADYFNKTRLGKYSSGIYVWHAPLVLPFVSILGVKIFGGGWIVLPPTVAGTILLSIALSKITYKYHILRFWRL